VKTPFPIIPEPSLGSSISCAPFRTNRISTANLHLSSDRPVDKASEAAK
jgi:hypothetical protein